LPADAAGTKICDCGVATKSTPLAEQTECLRLRADPKGRPQLRRGGDEVDALSRANRMFATAGWTLKADDLS
jgi:hypothetical protein